MSFKGIVSNEPKFTENEDVGIFENAKVLPHVLS